MQRLQDLIHVRLTLPRLQLRVPLGNPLRRMLHVADLWFELQQLQSRSLSAVARENIVQLNRSQ